MIITRFERNGEYVIFFDERNIAVIAIAPEGHETASFDGLYRYNPDQIKIIGVDEV